MWTRSHHQGLSTLSPVPADAVWILLSDADQGFLSTFLPSGAGALQDCRQRETALLSCSPPERLPALGGTEGVDNCRKMPCKEPGKEARNAWWGAQGHAPASQVCWPLHPPAETALPPQRKLPSGPLPVPSLQDSSLPGYS